MIANVRIRAFVYPTEDEERVAGAVERLVPGAEAQRSRADSAHGGEIVVLEIRVEKKRLVDAFFRGLSPELVGNLLSKLPDRLDESGHLFFRLDKQELVLGRLRLTSGGDTVAIECAAHGPKSKTLEVWRNDLGALLDSPP